MAPRELHRRLLAPVLVALACHGGPGGDDGGTTQPASAAGSTPVIETGGSSTGDEVLACEPDQTARCEATVCLPKHGACPVECDQACEASPEAQGVLQGCFVTCRYELSTLCGPAVQSGRCCYVVHVEDIGCVAGPGGDRPR
jgi:hypothetical protein